MDRWAGSERPLYYRLDADGRPEPVDMKDPLRWHGDAVADSRRKIAADNVTGYLVSTVFLVIDHAFDGGPPVLWETMVFGSGPWDEWQDRYTSREAAVQGHARVVAALRAGKKPEDLDES
jgi:hypothetical protein